MKYKKVEEFIEEAALIDFRGKHLVHVTGKVKSVFPDGEFQIDLSKLSNISTARLDYQSIGSSTDFHRLCACDTINIMTRTWDNSGLIWCLGLVNLGFAGTRAWT